MVNVESYTKIVTDTINTHLPNSSGYNKYNHLIADNNPSVVVDVVDVNVVDTVTSATDDCIDLGPFSSFSSFSSSTAVEGKERSSTVLVILRWIVHHFKIVYHASLKRYLSHPITLALLPLCIGLCVGFLVGWYYHHLNDDTDSAGVNASASASASSKNKLNKNDTDLLKHPNHNINHDKLNMNKSLEEEQEERDTQTRNNLKSAIHTQKESTIPIQHLPKHIAIIMDGNRRYGRSKYNSITRGHWDGSKTLMEVSKWCIAEHIPILTVYAFSTENWNRSQKEVSSLMKIFRRYCDELRVEAKERGICVRVLSTETDQIPKDVAEGIQKMVEETANHNNNHHKLTLNICLSYGSRGEILNATRSIAHDIQTKTIACPNDITESTLSSKMLTYPHPDPDLVIRTSGEYRLSNFLLWQLAYAEMFFIDKNWPELTKCDLVDIIHSYAMDRKRRYGK